VGILLVVVNILLKEGINATCGNGGSDSLKVTEINKVIQQTYSTLDKYYCTSLCPCKADWAGFPKTASATSRVKSF